MRLVQLFCALALFGCTPPAQEAPEPAPPPQAVDTTADCIAEVEAINQPQTPVTNCNWAAVNRSAPAESFVGYYDPTSEEIDGALAVAPTSDGGYVVGVSTIFAPSLHLCGGVFDGRVEGDVLALTPRDEGGQACRARLVQASNGEVRMQAEGDCSYYCGARATLNGVTYARDSSD